MIQKPKKRQYRNDMPDSQREKISQKLSGRKLSNDTKRKISKSMQVYWASLPMKPVTGNNNDINTNKND